MNAVSVCDTLVIIYTAQRTAFEKSQSTLRSTSNNYKALKTDHLVLNFSISIELILIGLIALRLSFSLLKNG